MIHVRPLINEKKKKEASNEAPDEFGAILVVATIQSKWS